MACCKECTKRVQGCHSTCEDYKKYKEEQRKRSEELRKQRIYDGELIRILEGGNKWRK